MWSTKLIKAALCVATIAIALCNTACTQRKQHALLVRFDCKFGENDTALPIVVNIGEMSAILVTHPDSLIYMHLGGAQNELVLSIDGQSEAPPKIWIRADGSATLREKGSVRGQVIELKGTCERDDA